MTQLTSLRRGSVTAPLILGLIVLLAVLEFRRPRPTTGQPTVTGPIPASIGTGRTITFTTTPEPDSGPYIYAITNSSAGFGRYVLVPGPAGPSARGPFALGPAIPGAKQDFIGLWTPGGRSFAGIGVANPQAESLDIRVSLTRNGVPTLLRLHAPAIPRPRGFRRDVVSAAARSGAAELVVVDRSYNSPGPMAITVLSGSTSFRRIAKRTVVPRGYPAAMWQVTAGFVNAANDDLLFISRGATKSGRTEIHALLGNTDYRSYGEQRTIGLASRAGAGWTWSIAHSAGRPILYGIDPKGRVVHGYPI